MPPTPASRTRLAPVAVAALALAGVLVLGAVAVLVWVLNGPAAHPNREATDRLVQWQEVFERYRDAHGVLPDLPAGGYCLGTGFPVGTGGTANCRDYAATSYYTEASSAPLLDALATVSGLPKGTSAAVRGTIGPYAVYDDAGVRLLTAESAVCEPPAVDIWDDGGELHICEILLQR